MNFIRTRIPDVVIIEPVVHGDDRGYFAETFRKDKLEKFLGFKLSFCQDNESKSTYGVLRGLHYQLQPFAQTKLVKVITGEVLDVAVDIRKESPTFGQHVSVLLNEENKRQLFVPRGFAHGFVVLSKEAIFEYKVDNVYSQESERGIAFDDKSIGIQWPLDSQQIKLSEKDKKQPFLKDAEIFINSEKLYV